MPQPCVAVILLFPCTERIYAARAAEEAQLRKRLVDVVDYSHSHSDSRVAKRGVADADIVKAEARGGGCVMGRRRQTGLTEAAQQAFHVEQVASFGNACGTIACIHTLANLDEDLLMGGAPGPASVTSTTAEAAARGQAAVGGDAKDDRAPTAKSDARATAAESRTHATPRAHTTETHAQHLSAEAASSGSSNSTVDSSSDSSSNTTSAATSTPAPIVAFRRSTIAQSPAARGRALLTSSHLKLASDAAAEHRRLV